MIFFGAIAASLLAPIALQSQSAAEFYQRGRAQMDADNPEASIKSFEKAVALNSNSSDYHFWLGRAYGFSVPRAGILRRPFLAHHIKGEFDKALELDSANVGAREGLAMYYTLAPGIFGGSLAKAREHAAILSALDPMRGHYARARIAAQEKDFFGADAEYGIAVAENPDSLSAAMTYAEFLMKRNRASEALNVVDRFVQRHPEKSEATVWVNRMAALATAGKAP